MNTIKTSLPLIALASSMCIAMLAIHTTALGAQTYYSCPTGKPTERPQCFIDGKWQYGNVYVTLVYSNGVYSEGCSYIFSDNNLGSSEAGTLQKDYSYKNCASHLTGKRNKSQFVFDLSYNTVMKDPQKRFSLKDFKMYQCNKESIELFVRSPCGDNTISEITLNVTGDGDGTFTGKNGIAMQYQNISGSTCPLCTEQTAADLRDLMPLAR